MTDHPKQTSNVNENNNSVDIDKPDVNDQQPQPAESGELRDEAKATVLIPLADKFHELTRQIDSGEYKLPETLQEVEGIIEDYIEQAWERLEQLIAARLRLLLDELEALGPKDAPKNTMNLNTPWEAGYNSSNGTWRSLLAQKRGEL